MPHYGQFETKLYRQTLLQSAFNKGRYCPSDAEWIWGWGLCSLDEEGPRGPAAQSGLCQSPAFLSLSERHWGSIGNCLLSTERARKFINTLLFILKILQKTEHLLKSQNDGFIDFPVAHQHSYDPAALTNTSKSFLSLCLLLYGLAWYECLWWLIL